MRRVAEIEMRFDSMPMPGGVDHSIADVSNLTGVSCHNLRIWERRYGFPNPHRSASGHRRYSPDLVAAIRDLAVQARAGQPVRALIEQYREAGGKCQPQSRSQFGGESAALVVMELLGAGDLTGAEAILDRLQSRMSPLEIIEELLEPALIEIGERSFRQEILIYQDRTANVCLLGRLHCLLSLARRTNVAPRRRVLVGSVEGETHEGGSLMTALALELAGWRAIPMGVNVPVHQFEGAVEAWKPDALALSFAVSRNINKQLVKLTRIRSIPVFVGGRSIVNHQSLARRLGLFPLTGPLSSAVTQLILDSERWYQDRPRAWSSGLVASSTMRNPARSLPASSRVDPSTIV